MTGKRIQLESRAPFSPMGEGYRYLLLPIITVAVLCASTGAVFARVTQTRVAPAPVATPMPADMPGMVMAPTGVAQPAVNAPAAAVKPVTVSEISPPRAARPPTH